jgi:hypothetical protein
MICQQTHLHLGLSIGPSIDRRSDLSFQDLPRALRSKTFLRYPAPLTLALIIELFHGVLEISLGILLEPCPKVKPISV